MKFIALSVAVEAADQVRKPAPRVPKVEAQQVFDALKQTRTIVELHSYPQEGHGFERREDRIDALQRTVGWSEKYLKPR